MRARGQEMTDGSKQTPMDVLRAAAPEGARTYLQHKASIMENHELQAVPTKYKLLRRHRRGGSPTVEHLHADVDQACQGGRRHAGGDRRGDPRGAPHEDGHGERRGRRRARLARRRTMSVSASEERPRVLPDQLKAGAQRVALAELFLAYLQIGLTAFGFTMLQKVVQLVVGKKRWLTREQADHGLALVQLYPGPIMVDFTAYVGYRLRGVKGALVGRRRLRSALVRAHDRPLCRVLRHGQHRLRARALHRPRRPGRGYCPQPHARLRPARAQGSGTGRAGRGGFRGDAVRDQRAARHPHRLGRRRGAAAPGSRPGYPGAAHAAGRTRRSGIAGLSRQPYLRPAGGATSSPGGRSR